MDSMTIHLADFYPLDLDRVRRGFFILRQTMPFVDARIVGIPVSGERNEISLAFALNCKAY